MINNGKNSYFRKKEKTQTQTNNNCTPNIFIIFNLENIHTYANSFDFDMYMA
jgi:hypothetical protein